LLSSIYLSLAIAERPRCRVGHITVSLIIGDESI